MCFRALRAWRVCGGRVTGGEACWSWIVGRDDVVCVSCLSACLAHLVCVELLPSVCLGVASVLPVMVPTLLFSMLALMLWVVHEGLRHLVL